MLHHLRDLLRSAAAWTGARAYLASRRGAVSSGDSGDQKAPPPPPTPAAVPQAGVDRRPAGPAREVSLDVDYSADQAKAAKWARATRASANLLCILGVGGLLVGALWIHRELAGLGGLAYFARLFHGDEEWFTCFGLVRGVFTLLAGFLLVTSWRPVKALEPKGRERAALGLGLLFAAVAVYAVVVKMPDFGGVPGMRPVWPAVLFGLPALTGLVFLQMAGETFRTKGVVEPDYINIVDRMLTEAQRVTASDIHVEPGANEVAVRFRLDGVLYTVASYPQELADRLVSRIKVMANMDIAEKRAPQDGGARLHLPGKDIDLRISTVPSSYGERAVVRMLDPESGVLGLPALGLEPEMVEKMDEIIRLPHGVFFCTGPTGSGKTTTLYAALQRVGSGERNVITVEDPVEYRIPGVNQLQVSRRKGMTFASGLRSILRQDPDVIMVGEVRDAETAHMVIEAAQTGHLVLTTLHTNDAAGAVARLLDLGIEPFLLSSCLTAVLAQRLMRRVCPQCAQPYKPSPAELRQLGLAIAGDITLHKGMGCEHCMYTGFRGRTGVFELLLANDAIRDLITARADAKAIKKMMMEDGVMDLRMHAAQKVLRGITTSTEMQRVQAGMGG